MSEQTEHLSRADGLVASSRLSASFSEMVRKGRKEKKNGAKSATVSCFNSGREQTARWQPAPLLTPPLDGGRAEISVKRWNPVRGTRR